MIAERIETNEAEIPVECSGYWKYDPDTNNYRFIEGADPSINRVEPLIPQEPSGHPDIPGVKWASFSTKTI